MMVSAKPSILIIDDSISIQQVIGDILRLMSYDVVTAENGQQGVAMLEAHNIDLILLDTNMPVMDGPATLRAVRKLDADVPVIVCSSDSLSAIAPRYGRHPISHFLRKPFDMQTLLHTVSSLLPETALSSH